MVSCAQDLLWARHPPSTPELPWQGGGNKEQIMFTVFQPRSGGGRVLSSAFWVSWRLCHVSCSGGGTVRAAASPPKESPAAQALLLAKGWPRGGRAALTHSSDCELGSACDSQSSQRCCCWRRWQGRWKVCQSFHDLSERLWYGAHGGCRALPPGGWLREGLRVRPGSLIPGLTGQVPGESPLPASSGHHYGLHLCAHHHC